MTTNTIIHLKSRTRDPIVTQYRREGIEDRSSADPLLALLAFFLAAMTGLGAALVMWGVA